MISPMFTYFLSTRLQPLGEVTSGLAALAMIIELVVDGIDGITSLEYLTAQGLLSIEHLRTNHPRELKSN